MIGHAARSAAASEWLAQAHPFPPQVKEEWSDPQRGVALIPTGHTFDTVRVAAHLVHAAADSSNEAAVAGFLSALVDGPIIHDAYSATSAYYFLVPLGSCAHHLTPDAQLLAPGVTWLGVPHLSRTARPGSFWVLAPRQRDDLCIPGYVDQLIRAGRKRLAEPPPELPGMDRIEAECRALTDPEGPADPSFEDAHLLLLRLRGYLLQLVPAVEERADRRPPEDPYATRGRYEASQVRVLLSEVQESCILPRMYEQARRHAAGALTLVGWLREHGTHGG